MHIDLNSLNFKITPPFKTGHNLQEYVHDEQFHQQFYLITGKNKGGNINEKDCNQRQQKIQLKDALKKEKYFENFSTFQNQDQLFFIDDDKPGFQLQKIQIQSSQASLIKQVQPSDQNSLIFDDLYCSMHNSQIGISCLSTKKQRNKQEYEEKGIKEFYFKITEQSNKEKTNTNIKQEIKKRIHSFVDQLQITTQQAINPYFLAKLTQVFSFLNKKQKQKQLQQLPSTKMIKQKCDRHKKQNGKYKNDISLNKMKNTDETKNNKTKQNISKRENKENEKLGLKKMKVQKRWII